MLKFAKSSCGLLLLLVCLTEPARAIAPDFRPKRTEAVSCNQQFRAISDPRRKMIRIKERRFGFDRTVWKTPYLPGNIFIDNTGEWLAVCAYNALPEKPTGDTPILWFQSRAGANRQIALRELIEPGKLRTIGAWLEWGSGLPVRSPDCQDQVKVITVEDVEYLFELRGGACISTNMAEHPLYKAFR